MNRRDKNGAIYMSNDPRISKYRILKNNIVISENTVYSQWLALVYETFIHSFKDKDKIFTMEVFINNEWVEFISPE